MKRAILIVVGFILFSSHDMFLKLDTYYLDPNVESTIVLLNGTFDLSENSIDRNRMIDVSLVGNGIRTSVDNTQWHDQDNATILTFNSGEAGTWVAGVSTKARNIKLAADDFNNYLEHDGVLDELNWRKENNALETDAVEKYSKHVKTIFQVGDLKTDDWKTVLNYPIEFVPLSNPYDIHPGEEIKFKLLLNGSPLTNQLIYVGSGTSEHSHDHDHEHQGDDHQHTDATQLKTDNNGVITVDINAEGIWYLRTIHMARLEDPELSHESNWATLTFEVGHGHSHAHGHSHGIPIYYWIGAIVLLLGGILWWVNRK